MNTFERGKGFASFLRGMQILFLLLTLGLVFPMWTQTLEAQAPPEAPPEAPPQGPPGAPPATGQGQPYTQGTPEQLQQLVAPIALYPDSLVAQILAASTFPDQIVEADRWVQANPGLQGQALGQAVDQQPWDPSVKALTAFPAVLGNMDKNLSWTSALGDAYYNQQQDVMDAIQVMRQRAQASGNLRTTPQQVVSTEGPTIVVQPANPEVVYVPAYDPWVVYGGPIMAWPGWYPYPGIWYGGPYLSFGIGFGIGFFGHYGWGWNHWGFDWHHRYATFGGGRYYSRSNTFYYRNSYRGGAARGGVYSRGGAPHGEAYSRGNIGRPGGGGGPYHAGAPAAPFNGNHQAARGYAAPRGQTGVRSNAFSSIEKGGQARTYSSRGSTSYSSGAAPGGSSGAHAGGGGGAHGGGGGHH